MGFSEYDAAGEYYTSLSCDPDDAAENLEIVGKVLAEVQRDGLTAEELERAKSKIGSRVVRGSERPIGHGMGASDWEVISQSPRT